MVCRPVYCIIRLLLAWLAAIHIELIVEARELVFSNVVWRHGDRSYIMTYPNDPYKNESVWPMGLGQLTNIGMKEQYELGKFIRNRYNSILGETYNRKDIYIRSTDKDRTLMSAASNLAGLYPPTSQDKWNGSFTTWHPIPVHSVPLTEDKLLHQPTGDCPNYEKMRKQITTSSWYIEHEKNYSEFYKMIENVTGALTPYNLTNIWEVQDNLFCLSANNFSIPDWATPDVVAKLKDLNSLGLGLFFTDVQYKYREEISKMQGGTLLKEIIANMTAVIEGTSSYSMIAYSAHDTTLTAFLVSLGNYNWVQPKYASMVMVELYKEKNNYFVELYYKSSPSSDDVVQLKFYNCTLSCPIESFVSISQNLIPDDRDELCGNDASPSINMFYWIFGILFILLTLSVFLNIVLLCRKKKNHNYQHLSLSEDDPPI